MRRLRKKLYKHFLHQKGKKKDRKNRDVTEEVIKIFKQRQVPKFVADSVRRRRNFDLATLKNLAINSSLPLEEIRGMSNRQENEITVLFGEHKQRMEEIRERLALMKAEGQDVNMLPNGIYSTSSEENLEECESSEHDHNDGRLFFDEPNREKNSSSYSRFLGENLEELMEHDECEQPVPSIEQSPEPNFAFLDF